MHEVHPKSNHSKNSPLIRFGSAGRLFSALAQSAVMVFFLSVAAGPAHADCATRSSENRVPLLELYTSEGCDSCPPADRWLSALQEKGFDPSRVVALAFHVDYWDYLGWRDRFSDAGFSARQRSAVTRGGAKIVYTPQFFLNGTEFRVPARTDELSRRLDPINRQKAVVSLEMTQQRSANTLAVRFEGRRASGNGLQLFVALFENGLETEVRAGENAGKKLRHDFVVRALRGPIDWSDKPDLRADLAFKLDPAWRESAMGIAAFVQDPRTGDAAQALAVALCRS